MFSSPFAFVDIETTGGSPSGSRVLEVGIVRVERGEIVEEYQTLVNPEDRIPNFITSLTGISDSDVAGAPLFYEIVPHIARMLDGATFVAHNSSFDYSFLKEEFKRLKIPFAYPNLCTVKLSRALYPEHRHHNLTSLIERHKLSCENRHRAFDDAKVLWDFMQLISREFPEERVKKTVDALTRQPRKSVMV